MNLKKFFNPQSIAVIGASPKEGKVGKAITKNILELGYAGKTYLVNPKYNEIFERKCYKNLSEIKNAVDLAIIIIPAKFVVAEIKKNAERVKNFIIISAGFSEIGAEGQKREKELFEIAKKNKLNILGPNCLGFIIPSLKLNASFASGLPKVGHISFISQSGALAVALIDMAKKENIKFSNIISIGNKIQISESELLEFAAQDKDTQVIGMYLENIKNGKQFIETAQKVSKNKPVVILKAGKNAKTKEAISLHTGALAGNDEIVSAVFKKAGVLRADNLENFFGLLNLISESKKALGQKSIIITNAGGMGVLTADAFNKKNIQLADLDETIKNNLRVFLPKEASVENPIDLLGDARQDRYAKTLDIISKLPQVDSIICILTPQDQTPVEKIADEIIKFKETTDKMVVTIFLGGAKVAKAIAKFKESGICNFNFPDKAVTAMDEYYQWSKFKKPETSFSAQPVNFERRQKVIEIIQKAKAQKRSALYFKEAKEIMEMYQIAVIKYEEILPKNTIDLELGIDFPVALKIDSDKILHKTDKQGLILDIKNHEQLKESVKKMETNFPKEPLIIQPMTQKGTELIIGIKQDATFGPVMVYGLGGIYTEVLHQINYLIPPLSLSQIENSLQQSQLGFLFQNTRGQKKYNLKELSEILLNISYLAVEVPEIKGFDMNPLFTYNNGKEAIAVDVKIII